MINDNDSTDEYMKVDEAPQRIRNSSSKPLVLANPTLSIIEKNRALLGQLNLVKIKLKKTVDDYQH